MATTTSSSTSSTTTSSSPSLTRRSSLSLPSFRVAILDAGAQYGKVIDRRVRELSVYSDLLPLNTPASSLVSAGYSALIISGGPQSVYGAEAPQYDPKIFEIGLPILGICYGFQLINYVYGGKVVKKTVREDGQFSIRIQDKSSLLFHGLPDSVDVLLTHGDSAETIASSFTITALSTAGIVTAIEHPEKKIYGVQFHPEVDLTPCGKDIFVNFFERVCGAKREYTLKSRKEEAIRELKRIVGDEKKVLILVSGGVDSTVCAALLEAAIPPSRIFAVHVDNGFMRKNESTKVAKALSDIGARLDVVDASEKFYNAWTMIDGHESERLKDTVKPEVKRKIIGDTFMRVSEEAVRKYGLKMEDVFLAQGTLRPDLIESASSLASSNADVIKTHHNDTALVRQLRAAGRIVEPLRDCHKDEVRQMGLELGLPDALVWRQPFPGPGLAVRIICAEQPFRTEKDEKICEQLKAFTSEEIQPTLLPVRTVGVQGDARSYSSLVGLSSSEPFPCAATWEKLFALAKEIPKTIHGINRVAFVFGEKLQSAQLLSITPTHLTPDVIALLQEADQIVNDILYKHNLIKPLSQVPVILFPVDFGLPGQRAIAIRTFITNDFMTGVPAVPGKQMPVEALKEMVEAVAKVKGVARVCYDLTAKPPGTTEWE